MHTYTDLCLAHPLESWTTFDIVVNSAYALLTMPATYKLTNVINFPFARGIRHQRLQYIYQGRYVWWSFAKVVRLEEFPQCLVSSATTVLHTRVFSTEFPEFLSLAHRHFPCRAWSFSSIVVASGSSLLDREALLADRFCTLKTNHFCTNRWHADKRKIVDVWTRVQH